MDVQDLEVGAESECYICKNPVVSRASGSECAQACRDAHSTCYECLMWWFHEVLVKEAQGGQVVYKCPCCKTPSRSVHVADLDINKELLGQYRHLGALSSSAPGAVGAEAGPSVLQAEAAAGGGPEFDIHYIAGIHVTGASGEVKYKVVWRPEDVVRGEEPFQWVELDYVVQLGSKVRDFHSRWDIAPVEMLSAGFKWEHELPIFSRRDRMWRCPHEGCIYKTAEMCNCRKHIGSVHSPNKPRCALCGASFSNKSNLAKHVKKLHIRDQ